MTWRGDFYLRPYLTKVTLLERANISQDDICDHDQNWWFYVELKCWLNEKMQVDSTQGQLCRRPLFEGGFTLWSAANITEEWYFASRRHNVIFLKIFFGVCMQRPHFARANFSEEKHHAEVKILSRLFVFLFAFGGLCFHVFKHQKIVSSLMATPKSDQNRCEA